MTGAIWSGEIADKGRALPMFVGLAGNQARIALGRIDPKRSLRLVDLLGSLPTYALGFIAGTVLIAR